MPDANAYRLAAIDALESASPETREIIGDELKHQRSLEWIFIGVEITTVAVAAVLLFIVLFAGLHLIDRGSTGWGSATLFADIITAAGTLLGRSYFISQRNNGP